MKKVHISVEQNCRAGALSWALLVPLAILLSLPLLYFVARWQQDHAELNAELAAIRSRGEPTTAAELAAFIPTPPPELDCTALLRDAGSLFEKLDRQPEYDSLEEVGVKASPPLPGKAWPNLELARKYLRERAEILRLLRLAIAKGCRPRFVTTILGTSTLIFLTRSGCGNCAVFWFLTPISRPTRTKRVA